MSDPLIVKICGIKTPALLDAAIDAGADIVGFMHVERSPRYVDLETLQELISAARGRVETCVVLVNPDNSCVMEVAALSPDWIQLHGPETPHRVEAIRDEAGIAVMKVVGIGTAEDVASVPAFTDVAPGCSVPTGRLGRVRSRAIASPLARSACSSHGRSGSSGASDSARAFSAFASSAASVSISSLRFWSRSAPERYRSSCARVRAAAST